MKVQNGGQIQDGVGNVYIFHSKFSKMIFLSFFFIIYLHWVKIKLLWKKNFLEIENGGII
jgi:hypothetical protein